MMIASLCEAMQTTNNTTMYAACTGPESKQRYCVVLCLAPGRNVTMLCWEWRGKGKMGWDAGDVSCSGT